MRWKNIICDAIAGRKALRMKYSDGIWRTIEPHTYGTNTAGNCALSAYRTKKDDHTDAPDWKLYLDGEIIDIKVSTATFSAPRPGYNPIPKNFSKVICKL
ncbi:MAG TPA: hypothetical protein PL182_04945 [Pseudobdellovibrionaceae bacterium]|nr:hypothetical protein [Pseudobdellovibrionaceae bacterium]